jgi:hypothetical protein
MDIWTCALALNTTAAPYASLDGEVVAVSAIIHTVMDIWTCALALNTTAAPYAASGNRRRPMNTVRVLVVMP